MRIVEKEINLLDIEVQTKPSNISDYVDKWLACYNKLMKNTKMSLEEYSRNYKKLMLIRDRLWDYSTKQR